MAGDLCNCGSGRLLGDCHGLRGRERRGRALELNVLGQLHDLGFLFPFVRPTDELIDAFAWRVARGMKRPRDSAAHEVAEGVGLLPAEERERIVRSWVRGHRTLWARICRDVGDTALAEATLVASAVRGAVADRIRPSRFFVSELEDGALGRSPAAGPAFVMEPATIWCYDEVLRGENRVTRAHVARTRTQARYLEAWLPYDGLPRASELLREGCEHLADDEIARGVAGLLFEKYRVGVAIQSQRVAVRN